MDWEDADELCDEILEDIDDIPGAGQDFADSVRAKVESIQLTIQDNANATDKQVTALQNIHAGVKKWLR